MRKAINDNPMVQLGVIGVLMVGVGLMLATSVLKKDSNEAQSAADSTMAGSAGGSVDAASTLPPTTAAPAPSGSVSPPPAAAPSPTSLVPGPGLPASVVDAWKGGDAIVLLVVRNKGVDDRLVRGSVRGLEGKSDVAVFVAKAKDIARYSRITQGVGVTRVPALVVVRPQRLSGSVPQAQVSYGFRDSASVLQAVDDALYTGRDNVPYYPQ